MPIEDLRRAIVSADPEMLCFLLLGCYGGLRCIESSGLDREDVLEDEGMLRIRQGKGGYERTVPLHPDVLAALKAFRMPARGALFRRPQGHDRYTAGALSHVINYYLHGLGIKSTAHTLRHWFASQLYGNSQDLRLVQELLGHSSPTTTAVYTAIDPKASAPAVFELSIFDSGHVEVGRERR